MQPNPTILRGTDFIQWMEYVWEAPQAVYLKHHHARLEALRLGARRTGATRLRMTDGHVWHMEVYTWPNGARVNLAHNGAAVHPNKHDGEGVRQRRKQEAA